MRRSLLLRVAALAALSLASACVTVGPNFTRPAAPATQSYAMAGDAAPGDGVALAPAAAPAGWWRAFGSSDLNAVVDFALANNRSLAAADASLARAQASAAVARGEAGPDVDAHANVARERINSAAFGFSGFPSPTISLYSIGASASFNLDPFGGERRRVESAEARAQAEVSRRDAAYLTLTGDVVTRAIEIASLDAQIAALSQVIDDDRRTLDMTNRAIEAGGSPRAAANTAEAQLAEDEARLPPLRARYNAARHALALLVGQAPSDWTAPHFDLASLSVPQSVPVSLPSELVRRRPDILVAEARLHAATADVGVATAAMYPRLTLSPDFTLAALEPSEVFNYTSSGWSFGPSLTAPLFHSGALRAGRNAADATRREALANYEQTVLTAFVQVADLLDAVAQDQALLAAQTHASDAAAENARLANLAYENGAGSLIQVLDAQRQAQRARLGLIDAQERLRRDIAALFVASAADVTQNQAAAR
ncbi:MAG TPA: efflux transporter outer membrane subunit [Caulobacterales bacterium]|nr:efflux transporter outer membrane subunit [Caulobacterales bacterium]